MRSNHRFSVALKTKLNLSVLVPFTVDDTTSASTPGRIRISAKKFLAHESIKGLQSMLYAGLLQLPQSLLFKFFRTNKLVIEWIRRNEQFELGCVNPTVVVDVEKGVIATFTNLTAVEDAPPTPVLKFSQEKLRLAGTSGLANGSQLATVAVYYPNTKNHNAKAWADFDPRVPDCFTDDAAACAALVNGISKKAWRCLQLSLEQNPYQNKLGLFKVNLEEDLVNRA